MLRNDLEAIKLKERIPSTGEEESKNTCVLDEQRLTEELLWIQRSTADWLKEGDLNTKYFHSKASQRHKANTITKLMNTEGNVLTDKARRSKKVCSGIFY